MRWLGATGRRPAVEVLLAPEGERLRLSLRGDDGALDNALAREGWIAVEVGERVIALVDGDWFHPLSLGRSWGVAPAADARQVILVRGSGADDRIDQPVTVELVDAVGAVRRSVVSSWAIVVGELREGELVCRQGLLSWGGELRSSPWPGEPFAVISGCYVLTAGAQVACMYDTCDGSTVVSELAGHCRLCTTLQRSAWSFWTGIAHWLPVRESACSRSIWGFCRARLPGPTAITCC
jgi:hypothetical protein